MDRQEAIKALLAGKKVTHNGLEGDYLTYDPDEGVLYHFKVDNAAFFNFLDPDAKYQILDTDETTKN